MSFFSRIIGQKEEGLRDLGILFNRDDLIADSKRVHRLIVKIKKCFDNCKPPETSLHVARGLDDEWALDDQKYEELRALDTELHWSEVSLSKIEGFQEYFIYSDNEGWAFYLPAFMTAELLHMPNYSYEAAFMAVKSRAHISKLNQEQIECIDEFYELCLKYRE